MWEMRDWVERYSLISTIIACHIALATVDTQILEMGKNLMDFSGSREAAHENGKKVGTMSITMVLQTIS